MGLIKSKPPKRARWRVLTTAGKAEYEIRQAMTNAQGRCEAFPRYEGDEVRGATPVRCTARATEVVEEIGPKGLRYIAMCTACRRAGCGATPAERGTRTKATRARQLKLGGDGFL